MARGRTNYVWNMEKNDFIKKNAGLMKDAVLAEEMSKRFGYKFTVVAIRLQRRSLGIKKKNGRGKCEIQD